MRRRRRTLQDLEQRTPSRRRRRGLIRRMFSWRRLLLVAALVALVVAGGPALFIATQCYGNGTPTGPSTPEAIRNIQNATRAEANTYLTLPEWLIVYSGDEYGQFIAQRQPSAFPHLRSSIQYWSGYRAMCGITKREYPFESGYHMMLGVIGASFTVENVLKGVYEGTIGRVTEWIGTRDTPEDAFAVRTAQEYGTFMHTTPWYEFPFAARLAALWTDTPAWGPHVIRKWERRLVLSAEYGIKAVYGWLLGQASGAAYAPEDLAIYAWVENAPPWGFSDRRVETVRRLGTAGQIVKLPRYEAFTQIVLALHAQGVRFVNIAGNDEILVTAIGPAATSINFAPARLAARMPLVTDHTRARFALRVPVASLHEILTRLRASNIAVEHLYDY